MEFKNATATEPNARNRITLAKSALVVCSEEGATRASSRRISTSIAKTTAPERNAITKTCLNLPTLKGAVAAFWF